MHGVVREYRLDPANVDEVIRRITEIVPSLLQPIPGFVSYALNNPGDGRLMSYSVYEDASGTQESTRRAASWVRDNIAHLLPSPHRITEGELRVREAVGQPKFGVVRRFQAEPKNMDTIVARAREGFVPIVSSLPGFTSYTILDAGNGTALTLSGFTSRESADESTRRAVDWIRENLGPLLPNPPEVISGEIRYFLGSSKYQSSTKTEGGRRRAA